MENAKRENDKQKQKERQLAYYYANREQRLAYAREYYRTKKQDKNIAMYYDLRRRARIKGYNPDDFIFIKDKKIDLKAFKTRYFLVFDKDGKVIAKHTQKQLQVRFGIDIFQLLLCVEHGTHFYGMYFDEE